MKNKTKTTFDKYMTIGLVNTNNDTQAAVNISPDLTASEAYLLLGTLALHLLKSYYKVATTDLAINHNSGKTNSNSKLSKSELDAATKGIKDSMYDAMDTIFSNVLAQFMPEHPKYSLEDAAIIELTNQKIEEEYSKLTDKEKAKYKETYTKLKAKLLEEHYNEEHAEDTATTSDSSTTESTK